MKLLLVLATAGLAFVVLKRRRPEFADRVESAVKDAAEQVREESPGDIADRLKDKARSVVSS